MARPTTTSGGLPLGTRPAGSPILPLLSGTPKILCAGDSITIGTGSTDGSGYRITIADRLDDAGIAFEYVGPTDSPTGYPHYGNSGWNIAQLDAGIGAVIATYNPDVLILLIGRNNMDDATEATNAPTDYAALLATLYAAKPTLRIVACLITPEESATFQARTLTFRAALPAVLQASDAYGDGLLLQCDGGVWLQPLNRNHLGDGVHPNDTGYALLADAIWPTLQNALGRDAGW